MFLFLKKWWKRLELGETDTLVYKKLNDHRNFSANVFLYGGFLGMILWI